MNMYDLRNLVLLVIVCSFLPFPNVVLVDAQKLTSGTVFSVDLIHRNSPFSPYYNSSKSPLGSLSYHHRRLKLSSSYNASKNFQSEIQPDGGVYFMKIAVGTPPVEFTVIADTGSDLTWVQCSPCQRCIDQKSPLFDPAKSSTYHRIPCTSQTCNQPGITSACQADVAVDDNSCTYAIKYGGGTKTKGVLNTETITLSSSGSFPSFIFGCGYDQQGKLATIGEGLVGLGSGPLSLVSQLSPEINYKFSYCLTPEHSRVNSKLNFGLDVTGPGVVSTPFTNKDSTSFRGYHLTLDGITIGGTRIPMSTDIIIDSGTTLTFLPSSVYDDVRTTLKRAIEVSPVDDPKKIFHLCYDPASLDDDGFNLPDVVVHFTGADVVLKAENIFLTVDSLACLAMAPTDEIAIFGNIGQVNFQIGYDLQAKKVSFAPADCTKY